MKFFKWKIFMITSIVCLLPILAGVALWNKLPDEMAIHFDLYGKADGFASKGVVVFALPLLMVLMQAVSCFVNDLALHQRGGSIKFEKNIDFNKSGIYYSRAICDYGGYTFKTNLKIQCFSPLYRGFLKII